MEVQGTYGSNNTPTTVFYYDGWYVCEGGAVVNYTNDPVNDGVNVEELQDVDCFTWNEPIETLDDLINAVEN